VDDIRVGMIRGSARDRRGAPSNRASQSRAPREKQEYHLARD